MCRPVTVGQEQPGSPTPLLHCGKASGRGGRGLPHICLWTWCHVPLHVISYHINNYCHVTLIRCLVILVAYHRHCSYTMGLCVSHGYQIYCENMHHKNSDNVALLHNCNVNNNSLMKKATPPHFFSQSLTHHKHHWQFSCHQIWYTYNRRGLVQLVIQLHCTLQSTALKIFSLPNHQQIGPPSKISPHLKKSKKVQPPTYMYCNDAVDLGQVALRSRRRRD